MRIRKAAYVLIVLLLGMITLFSACSQKAGPEDVFAGRSGNYAAAAKISYKGMKAEAKISQETPASCSVVFKSPKSLEDMTFVFRSDSIDLSYKGLSFSFEQDLLPAAAVAKLMVSSIGCAMHDEGLEAVLNDGVIEITGMIESGEFILMVNEETGSPAKLFIPAEEFEIEFDNFTFLD